MIANGRIARSAGAGIAGAMIRAYAGTARFTRLSTDLSAVTARQNAAWETNVELTPAQAVVGVAALGGAFGLGYASLSRLFGRCGLVPGATYGVAFWAASEALYRRAPQRSHRWQQAPGRAVTHFALIGAAVGAFADRRFI